MTQISIAHFQEHADAVYAWAYRILGRHHDALDVVQEVFIRWSGQCANEPPSHPRGWLRRVTLNKAIDVIRAKSKHKVEGLSDQAASRSQTIDLAAADKDQLRRDVSNALEGLTDTQRSILVAKVFDELTFAEIAGEIGLAVSTVKTHYVRAVNGLHERLKGNWADALDQEVK